MKPEIIKIQPKILVGKSRVMSLAEDSTKDLWQSFMPHRKMISHRMDENLYNMKVFEPGFDVKQLAPGTPFMKWAAVEVKSFGKEPLEMDTYTMKGGLYAKFLHQGPAITFHETLEYIHTKWMPASEYQLDDREHFERFDEHYNPADPNAVEEVWIPIKRGTDL